MFYFAAPSSLYRLLGALLLTIELWLFVFSLPILRLGIWVQVEPSMMVTFLLAALIALWLALGIFKGWLKAMPPSPVWVLLVLWVLWQVVSIPLTAQPWRTWFGPAEMGEGTAWHVSRLLIFMLAVPFWQDERYRRFFLISGAVSMLTQAGLHFFNPPHPDGLFQPRTWAPGHWPAYLAFTGAFLWVASVGGSYKRRIGWYCVLILTVYPALYISANKSALLLTTAAIAISILVMAMRPKLGRRGRRFFFPGRVWSRLAIAACLAPILAVLWFGQSSAFLSQNDQKGLIRALGYYEDGIGSRFALNQIGLKTIQHDPMRLIQGAGWAHYSDDLFQHAMQPGVTVFKDDIRSPNWTMVDGYAFHSHNQPLEALLSFGLVGLILWLALPVCVILSLPRRYFWRTVPVYVSVVMVGYLWFMIPQCVPFEAIALAALACVCKGSTLRLPILRQRVKIAMLMLVAGIMLTSAVAQSKALIYDERMYAAPRYESAEAYSPALLEQDFIRGGDRFRVSAMYFLMWIASKDSSNQITENDMRWYDYFMRAAHKAAYSPLLEPRVAYTELAYQYTTLWAMPDSHAFAAIRKSFASQMEQSVLNMTRRAPLREDIASLFLGSLDEYTGGNKKKQLEITQRVLDIVPTHRGALWTRGHLLLNIKGREAEGRAMIRDAVARRVQDVFPIRKEELEPYLKKEAKK